MMRISGRTIAMTVAFALLAVVLYHGMPAMREAAYRGESRSLHRQRSPGRYADSRPATVPDLETLHAKEKEITSIMLVALHEFDKGMTTASISKARQVKEIVEMLARAKKIEPFRLNDGRSRLEFFFRDGTKITVVYGRDDEEGLVFGEGWESRELYSHLKELVGSR